MPDVSELVSLSDHTTLRVGGPARRFVTARTDAEITAAVRDADRSGDPLLVLGGGSNLVVADEGFHGTVVRVLSRGISADLAGNAGPVRVRVRAGEDWAALVDWAVGNKLAGIECLAGIPGLAGATPIQNVGAYGQEVAQRIETVQVLDRRSGRTRVLPAAECGFGYRTSLFKQAPAAAAAQRGRREPARGGVAGAAAPTGRYVVLAVTFALTPGPLSAPLRYPELAAALGAGAGDQVPLDLARDAVLELRRRKGMVLDPADPDTRSAGSFFTNPVLTAAQFGTLTRLVARRAGPGTVVPAFPAPDGMIKVPAAWLIEQAGFARGAPAEGRARISAKHTLALVNAGGATAAELLALAGRIRAGVRAAFGIELANEPVLVGLSWQDAGLPGPGQPPVDAGQQPPLDHLGRG